MEDYGCPSDIDYYETGDTAFLHVKKILAGIISGKSYGFFEICNPEILPEETDSLDNINPDSVLVIFTGGVGEPCKKEVDIDPYPVTLSDVEIYHPNK